MSSPAWSITSEATTAEEFRNEVVAYFEMRLNVAKARHCTGKERKDNEVLISEFRYQIDFWRNVKIG